jgi:phosphatidylinositol-3-phosphatase
VPRPVSPSADRPPTRARHLAVLGTALAVLGVTLTLTLHPGSARPGDGADLATRAAAVTPSSRHVFVINLENKSFARTWGSGSAAPYLATTLRAKGVLLRQYYATAHHSLGNYLAQISGQGPDSAIQGDCPRYTAFRSTRPAVTPQQAVGNGCVFPRSVRTLPRQLTKAGLGWKGYLEDMSRPCQHPKLGALDPWFKATAASQYATRHNPFVYFASITSRPAYCKAHVVNLARLTTDLQYASTTPALSYITPDLCHDGHDASCADGGPGGLKAANAWLRTWAPRILHSPAYQADGVLVITADESDGVDQDSSACCGEGPGPNPPKPGIKGLGGGRVGALVLSKKYVVPGTTSTHPYNHYSLLATLEDLFGLPYIGYARTVPHAFGSDVFAGG